MRTRLAVLFCALVLAACQGWSMDNPNAYPRPGGTSTPAPQVDIYRGTPPPAIETPPPAMTSLLRSQVLDALRDLFNEDELKELAFGLSIDFEDLPGETKSAKAVSLIEKCERTGQIDALIRDIKAARPQAAIGSPLIEVTPTQAAIQSRSLSLIDPCDLDGDGDCDGRDVEIMGRSMQTVNAPKASRTPRPVATATDHPLHVPVTKPTAKATVTP